MEKEIKIAHFSKTRDERDVMCRTDCNFGTKISFIAREYMGIRPKAGESWVVEVLQQPEKKINFVVPVCKFSNLTYEDFKKMQNVFSPDFSVKLDVWREKFVVRDKRGYVDVPTIAGEFDYDGSWDNEILGDFTIREILNIHKKCLPFRRKKEDGMPTLNKKYGVGYPDFYVFAKGEEIFCLILNPIDGRSNDDRKFLINFVGIISFSGEIEDEDWDQYIFEALELKDLCRRASAEMKEREAVRQEIGLEDVEKTYEKFARVNANEGEWHLQDIKHFLKLLKKKPEENKKVFCDWTKVKINPAQEEKFWTVLRRLMILDYISWEDLQSEGWPIADIYQLAEMSEEDFREKAVALSPDFFKFDSEKVREEFLSSVNDGIFI